MKQGIDADALDIGGDSFGEAIDKSFTGVRRAEMYDASKDKVTRYISKKYTNGDYGVISSGFNMPNGKSYEHAYNWKVENNAVKFFDGQQEISDASRYLDFINPSKTTEIYGLTNAIPNLEAIQSFVRLR